MTRRADVVTMLTMTNTFKPWPDICSFHERRRFAHHFPNDIVTPMMFRAKIKLHGTNAGINRTNGVVTAQSRNGFLTPEGSDNAGFRTYVEKSKAFWETVGEGDFTVFGEWAGPGVQKGVALTQIGKKIFAIFAILIGDRLMVSPEHILEFLGEPKDELFYVLPWHDDEIQQDENVVLSESDVFITKGRIEIDWNDSAESLSQKIAPINEWVAEVEKCDPWVKSVFNVEGTGEGLVFYPTSFLLRNDSGSMTLENFSNWTFKAKGEEHKNIKTAKPVQVDAEKAASVDAFAELVLTEARLQQGATAVGIEIKNTGKFVAWCIADVQKETSAELEASGLTWELVQKPLTNLARKWFIEQTKK